MAVHVLRFVAAMWLGLALQVVAQNVPTWPAVSDELEDLMFLQTGYRARGFSSPVTPCSFSAQGPSRIAAAEWIRTAFHDVATANTYFGTGGLDASIAFELGRAENDGNGFITTVTNQAAFFGPRASMADIIALGMYTAVRSCGGPVIPVKYGRLDATRSGDTGVPQPQNAIGTFQNQFSRLGLNTADMIAAVACGHSIGGVHAASQPLIVQAGTVPNDYAHLDSTSDVFDEKVASEFVDGTTQNPLVVGVSRDSGRDSDNRVFQADGNVTISSLSDPTTFRNTCRTIMQRLIEIVPSSVKLSANPLVAYEVKPYNFQLYLLDGGSNAMFSGEIRIRTTNRPASSISNVQIVYKDRTGGSSCGTCSITANKVGEAAAFDDNFVFYGFSATIPMASSISTVNVVVTTSGVQQTFDNNGNGFPVPDSLLLQYPQSCMGSSSSFTLTIALRKTVSGQPMANTIVRTARTNSNPVPILSTTSSPVTVIPGGSVGDYTLYAANITMDPAKASTAKFNITLGNAYSIPLQDVKSLPLQCAALPAAQGSSTTTSSTSQVSTSMSTTLSTMVTSGTTTPATSTITSTTTSSAGGSSSTVISTTQSTSSPSPLPSPTYSYMGCYFDSVSARTFTAKSTSSSSMTYVTCAGFCSTYRYFGLEYGAECYCSSVLPANSSTTVAPDSDCNMACAGDSTHTCGAGNRLSVFANSAVTTGPQNAESVGGFKYKGCYTDSQSSRTLQDLRLNSDNLTLSACAQFCGGYTYFGTEYGGECYCGNVLAGSSSVASPDECNMVCTGDSRQLCGAGDRLSLYQVATTS